MAYGDKKPLVVGFDVKEKVLIEEIARKNGCSQAELIRRIIKKHLLEELEL